MLFAVEHLEPELSEWLLIEYEHAVKIAGKKSLVITNLKKPEEAKRVSRFTRSDPRSVWEIFPQSKLLVLDPAARKALRPSDFSSEPVVVIGGILGDDPPQERTRKLLSSGLPRSKKRHLGRGQLSIDGAVFVAKQVAAGWELDEIPLTREVEVQVCQNCSVVLPFTYPVVEGKPLIAPKLVRYLKKKGLRF